MLLQLLQSVVQLSATLQALDDLDNPHPVRIKLKQDEQHDSKAYERRPAIAYKWQRYTYGWHDTYRHADIDKNVEEYNGCYPISVNTRKRRSLSFCYQNNAQHQ